MSSQANDSAPLAVRGVLVALVVCLHVAGAAALSHQPGPLPEKPSLLRASWIEASSPAPPPPSQPDEPLPVARVAPQRPAPVPSRPRTAESLPVPAPINTAPAVPTDLPVLGDSTPNPPHEDVFATAAATASGSASGEGSRDGNYVGPDFNVRYFSNPKPDYPPQSRRLREQGLVKLRVHVSEEGHTREVMLHTSSGYERLDNAALDAVRRWRFRPAQRAGTPVAGWVVVPVRFELQG